MLCLLNKPRYVSRIVKDTETKTELLSFLFITQNETEGRRIGPLYENCERERNTKQIYKISDRVISLQIQTISRSCKRYFTGQFMHKPYINPDTTKDKTLKEAKFKNARINHYGKRS